MRGYGVRFPRVEAGAYEAVDEDGNEVGGIYRDRFGVWRAQVYMGPRANPPYKAETFDSLKWAKRFVESNVPKA